MNSLFPVIGCILGVVFGGATVFAQQEETLQPLRQSKGPADFQSMWGGFDPRAEPLEVETIKHWEEEGVVLRIVRFRIGVFKGVTARLAAVYGYPKSAADGNEKVPGLLQIHGGGQYADAKACIANGKRGYATLSIAWAGRISARDYVVNPDGVKLFWDGMTSDPNYRLTTDWGAVDGYHAPGRNQGNVFPSAMPAPWTLDEVESPRNSGWFLCALAARRSLTFLERQAEVDPERLGVYGHSMGGKLTVMTATDQRVKVAAPSCGGISDRDNASPLFRSTLGDGVSLQQISCPIIFLSPANDFHGRIGDLPLSIDEIDSSQWRVTCSPHHSHQDSAEFEVATLLWFDQFLFDQFTFPQTPTTSLQLATADGIPKFTVRPDATMPILAVDVFYTQNGLPDETPRDREVTVNRHWRHAETTKAGGRWSASLPVSSVDKALWVYANVLYELESPVSGAGYYYGTYTATNFNVSSLVQMATPAETKSAGVHATLSPSRLIESFTGDWEKEWFSYRRDGWARTTHKPFDDVWKAPAGASLAFEVRADQANKLVVLLDGYGAEVAIEGGSDWQHVELEPKEFSNNAGDSLTGFQEVKSLKLSPVEHLRPARGDEEKPRVIGAHWQGADPSFRNLRWK